MYCSLNAQPLIVILFVFHMLSDLSFLYGKFMTNRLIFRPYTAYTVDVGCYAGFNFIHPLSFRFLQNNTIKFQMSIKIVGLRPI
jgi:hypothetical protein